MVAVLRTLNASSPYQIEDFDIEEKQGLMVGSDGAGQQSAKSNTDGREGVGDSGGAGDRGATKPTGGDNDGGQVGAGKEEDAGIMSDREEEAAAAAPVEITALAFVENQQYCLVAHSTGDVKLFLLPQADILAGFSVFVTALQQTGVSLRHEREARAKHSSLLSPVLENSSEINTTSGGELQSKGSGIVGGNRRGSRSFSGIMRGLLFGRKKKS
eukprot:jgi/Bigna1/135447/aug1.29_g10155